MNSIANIADKRPYDKCISCEHLGVNCDGPNLMAVSPERRADWANKLKKYRHGQEPGKWTNEYIARETGISIGAVTNFLSGKSMDMKISTIAPVMSLLIGSWGKYPCAMEGSENREAEEECIRLRERVAELGEQNGFLRGQIQQKDALLAERADYLRIKDKYIKWLSIVAGAMFLIMLGALAADAMYSGVGFFWR